MTAQLDEIAQLFLSNPDLPIVVVQGHASSGERHAARLARARADAVSAALVTRGVRPDWFQTRSIVDEGPNQEFVDFVVTEGQAIE